MANLPLDDKLAEKLQKELDATVKLVDELTDLDLSNVQATSQVTGQINVMRKDVVDKSRILPVKGYFTVKAIFNES